MYSRNCSFHIGFVGFLLFLLPVWGGAQQPAESVSASRLRTCGFIDDPQLRLRCYDEAINREKMLADADKVLPPSETNAAQGVSLFPARAEGIGGLSWLDHRWELSSQAKRGVFQIRPYKPVYLMPVFYNSRPNQLPSSPNPLNVVSDSQQLTSTEAKFQVSLKTKLVEDLFGDNGDIWFGYTQSSRWQVYNNDQSRPFRETNYEPEVMFTWRNSWSWFAEKTGWDPKMLGVSLNHQSNGRALPLSRSWNRVIGMVGFEKENSLLQVRPWLRLPEKEGDDDNPDINDYVGRVDYLYVHKNQGHEYSLLLRHNLRFNSDSRGAVEADWAFPLRGNLRGHLQFFSGYGESLIDYNHRSDYLGLGASLVGWY